MRRGRRQPESTIEADSARAIMPAPRVHPRCVHVSFPESVSRRIVASAPCTLHAHAHACPDVACRPFQNDEAVRMSGWSVSNASHLFAVDWHRLAKHEGMLHNGIQFVFCEYLGFRGWSAGRPLGSTRRQWPQSLRHWWRAEDSWALARHALGTLWVPRARWAHSGPSGLVENACAAIGRHRQVEDDLSFGMCRATEWRRLDVGLVLKSRAFSPSRLIGELAVMSEYLIGGAEGDQRLDFIHCRCTYRYHLKARL